VTVVGTLARTVTIQSGAPFEGVILLHNNDAHSPADVHLAQTDYFFAADGRNDYGAPGKNARSNANWFTLTPSRLRVAPGETQTVRYKGRAPSDAKLRGTYWSMIMVEPTAAAAISPEGKPNQIAVGLGTMVRFGVQIVTNLGGAANRSLKILDKALVREAGKRVLQIDVANDGEQLLVPAVNVELFDAKGVSLGRFDAGRSRIYPGCSVRAKTDLTQVPPGKYNAMVLLDSGDADVMGAQYELELQE
jgi:hypothetical protein